jgi:hypothetical protein
VGFAGGDLVTLDGILFSMKGAHVGNKPARDRGVEVLSACGAWAPVVQAQ